MGYSGFKFVHMKGHSLSICKLVKICLEMFKHLILQYQQNLAQSQFKFARIKGHTLLLEEGR